MANKTKLTKKHLSLALRILGILVLGFVFLIIGSYGYFALANQNKITANITINQIEVGGLNRQFALNKVETAIKNLNINITDGNKTATLNSKNPAETKIWFEPEKAVDQAMAYGKSNNPATMVVTNWITFLYGKNIKIEHRYDRGVMSQYLNNYFAGKNQQPQNAELIIRLDELNKKPIIAIAGEKAGVSIDSEATLNQIDQSIDQFSSQPINIKIMPKNPVVTAKMLEPLKTPAEQILNTKNVTLSLKTKTLSVTQEMLADWITAKFEPNLDNKPKLALDQKKVTKFLNDNSTDLAKPAVDAIFEMTGEKVSNFQPSQNGEAVDLTAALNLIEKAIVGAGPAMTQNLNVPFQTTEPKITTGASNTLGIKEIIGSGSSNFKGSPRNRIINITAGAKSVNGTIIQKGEEFSLLKTLGEISAATGYLEELVIKGNRTIPEFGGGLCQIGTTTFRATLASGLPVTVRQNHSYRVIYYERDGEGNYIGPGTDATIYDPNPDYRFLNDTQNAVLITTTITGSKLTFTFWGTLDGRLATQTKPTLTNVTPPPAPTLIPTTTLAPGIKKCTEKPHPGGTASFDYSITYPDGTIKNKTFTSKYRPWGEVCLIGVAAPTPITPNIPGPISADASGASGN